MRPVKQQHITLPEEDFELLDRGDFTEYEYLRARRLRGKRSRKAEERKFLAEHDAVEARIQSDPEAVLKQAREAIDEGTILLLKLIRSRKLRHEFTKEYPGEPWDDAMNCFTSRLGFLNRQFVRLSEDRTPKACFHLWYQAMNLAEAIVRLCAIFPEEFRSMAESSLMMPSLRARNPKFTCDAEAIIEKIHLAKKHPAPDVHDNRKRIGALCHFLVAKMVEEIEWARREKESFELSAKLLNSEEIIPSHVHPDWRELYEESWKLPNLHGKADDWWEGRVKKMVKREFHRIMQNPSRNPALWQELVKATDGGTEFEKWHALEKYCLNKMKQIAGEASEPS
jgi:hypothetical protein